MTERAGSIGYWFGVPNGEYVVKLHLAELWPGATVPGRRVMGINVNGSAQKDVDTVGEPGGRFIPFVRTIRTPVKDGTLEILVQDKVTHNRINGIEIIPAALAEH